MLNKLAKTGIAVAIICVACNNKPKPLAPTVHVLSKPVIMQPFTFHKLVEVSPGQDYDVLSWGRGTKDKGAFNILHSDSAAAKFTTTTGDLEGDIVDVYNSDMDLDGNPELIIQAKGKDTIYFTHIYAFEFNDDKAEKLDFPKLTKSQRRGYRGEDNFYIKDGILMREFPVYDGDNAGAKPTGQKRLLQYGLRDNSFTVKQLSTDSTAVTSVKAEIPKPENKTETPAKKPRKKHKADHQQTVRKTKKKKRHHHSD